MKIHGIKNIFFLLLLIFTSQALIAATILFDYHKVLALKDKNRGFSIKGFFSKENIWEKVAENPKGLFYYFYDMAQKPKDIDSSGGFYAAIARKNGLFKLAALTEKYSSEQYVPNRDLIALVEQLKAQGHTILLASNLDPRLLYIEINKSMGHMGADLKTNLFTDLIKGGLIVSYNQFRSPADKAEVEGLLADNLKGYKTTDYAKPNVKFFQDYLKFLASSADNTYFVDDKLDNVNAAQKAGIKAFHYKYEDDKTPDKINATAQLEQQFRNAGLLIDKQALQVQLEKDFYDKFYHEIGLIRTEEDMLALAQGNKELANDLENIYFAILPLSVIQEEINKLCKKWGLKPIKLR